MQDGIWRHNVEVRWAICERDARDAAGDWALSIAWT